MTQDLEALAQSDKPWVAQRAQMALMLIEQAQRGEISSSEYQELMLDLVRTDQLNAEADDLETKTMLVTAVYAVAQVV